MMEASSTMFGLSWDGARLRTGPHPLPVAGTDEVMVKVLLAGICATDLEVVKGYRQYQGILGHEFVGVVDDRRFPDWHGRRVVADINVACGACAMCLRSEPHHCLEGRCLGIFDRQGCFAEFVSMPARNLVEVPDSVENRQAVFCEPLAAALWVEDVLASQSEEDICLVGDGKLGLLIALALTARGYRVQVVGRHPERRGLLPDSAAYIDGSSASFLRRFTTVVEATGNGDGFRLAMDLVRPKGKIVLKSTFANDIHFDMSRLVIDEISVVGSRCGNMQAAMDLLAGGRLSCASLIAREFPPDQALEAMALAGSRGVLKVLLCLD